MSRLLSTSEVAKRCGVTAKTVARWVDSGVLPGIFTTGGHRRVRLEDVDNFLESRRSLMSRFAIEPGLKVVVLTPERATARMLESVGRRVDSELVVLHATTRLGAGILIGDMRPDLILVDVPVGGDAVCAELAVAPQSCRAYLAMVRGPLEAESPRAHRTLLRPIAPELVLEILRDARHFRGVNKR